MTPNDACKSENREKVLLNMKKYAKEFLFKKKTELKVGDVVLVKNEHKTSKNDLNFLEEAKIIEKEVSDVFVVEFLDKSRHRRHRSQLRLLNRGDVGSSDS